jgi:CDP-diacylglycerol--serine O-phosphatidyltransferase
MAGLLVGWQPTFSGKTLGRNIDRKYVLPLFAGAATFAAVLATYPYLCLLAGSLAYLASIPIAGRRFAARREIEGASEAPTTAPTEPAAPPSEIRADDETRPN